MLIKIGDTVLETELYRAFWLRQKELVFAPIHGQGITTHVAFDDAQQARVKFEKLVQILEPRDI
jgi:hypothetical protein